MTFTYPLLITQSQVDQKKHIKLKRLVDILQDVEALHIDSLQIFNDYLRKHQVGIFLMYREIHLFDALIQRDHFDAYTFPYQTNAIMGYRNTLIKNKQGEVVVGSYALGSFIGLSDIQVHRLPKDIVASLDHQEKYLGMTYYDRKISIDHLEFVRVSEVHVIKTHIDQYHHVNNSVYVDLVEHLIDDDYHYQTVRLEYKKALAMGNIAHVYKSSNHQNDLTILIKNESDEVCFIMMLYEKR